MLQNRNASIHLENIKNSINKNHKKDINVKLEQIKEKIAEDNIKGKITGDQFKILNEKVSKYLNQFNKNQNIDDSNL